MKVIEIKNVNKSFKRGSTVTNVLKNTNFTAEKGEFIAIIGPSGSGKSTFLTITGGLQTPDDGEVLIAGRPFSQLNEKERSKIRFDSIDFILQSSNLIPFLTVMDQLRFHAKAGRKDFDIAGARKLLDSLGALGLADKYPSELSGGERQRIAIARAIHHRPHVILADEPTASLDTKKAQDVVGILAGLAKEYGTTIIMVTHDKRMIKSCDKVYEMVDGTLI